MASVTVALTGYTNFSNFIQWDDDCYPRRNTFNVGASDQTLLGAQLH